MEIIIKNVRLAFFNGYEPGSYEGKPSVAPESDKRPAISVAPNADGMEEITDLVG